MIEGKRDTRLYGTVKVGDRGQVVIPAEARKELARALIFLVGSGVF